MQCPMPNPEQPDNQSHPDARTEAIPRGDHGVAEGPSHTLRIDGDDFSVMLDLDLVPDVALVDPRHRGERSPQKDGASPSRLPPIRGSPLEDGADSHPIQLHTAGQAPVASAAALR